MRFAILGSSGMLGSDLSKVAEARQLEYEVFSRRNFSLDSSADEMCREFETFDVLINAIAYTDVDGAETNKEIAQEVNANFVRKLGQVGKVTQTSIFHISTDYVFDGKSTSPYKTSHQRNPINSYGLSKADGERFLEDSSAAFTIFRTSWLYGSNGKDFPSAILRKLESGEPLHVVSDQVGAPTWTVDLAKLVFEYAEVKPRPSIVHASAAGQTSWFDFARLIEDSEPRGSSLISPVVSADRHSVALRPSYSVLDNSEGPIPSIRDWKVGWGEARNAVPYPKLDSSDSRHNQIC